MIYKRMVVFLLILNLVSAIAVVHAKHQNRKLFSELQSQFQLRDNLAIEFGQLQLEQSTWAAHGRVEEIARNSLNMHVPPQKTIQYLYVQGSQ